MLWAQVENKAQDNMHPPGYIFPLSLAFVISLVFVTVLCFFVEPHWETNDDIGMSMVAHGYGMATSGSPYLVFSNILWGYLVRVLPEIDGFLGYSIATLGVLVAVGGVVLYGCIRYCNGFVICLSVFALLLVRPVLFPQFTINAGLLLVAAVICWHIFSQKGDRLIILLGCLLAFLSYLVRAQEFLLILLVSLPIIPWKALWSSRSSKAMILVLIVAIIAAKITDYSAYQSDEWKSFNELNPVRAVITDHGANIHLKNRPDILDRYGYSANDVDLIRAWFFVDPDIANPQILQSMLTELGGLPDQGGALKNAFRGVEALWHPSLLPLTLAALLLALMKPQLRVFACWGLCVAAVFMMGFLGRPGVLRVYIPLLSLLVVVPLMTGWTHSWLKRLSAAVLLVAAVYNAYYVISEARMNQAEINEVSKSLQGFPAGPIVTWGATFPYEKIYPVLKIPSSIMEYRFYALGGFTLAPFSVAFLEEKAGRGLIELLVSEAGVPMVADKDQIRYLGIYCSEHYSGRLETLSQQEFGSVKVSWQRCVEG